MIAQTRGQLSLARQTVPGNGTPVAETFLSEPLSSLNFFTGEKKQSSL